MTRRLTGRQMRRQRGDVERLQIPNLQTPENTRCDSCGEMGLPRGRVRHEGCPPPPLTCSRCGQTYATVAELIGHHRPRDDEGNSMCDELRRRYQ